MNNIISTNIIMLVANVHYDYVMITHSKLSSTKHTAPEPKKGDTAAATDSFSG